jgi:hypothetical protein
VIFEDRAAVSFTQRGKEEEEEEKRELKRQLRALNCTHDWKKIGSPPLFQEKKNKITHTNVNS